ncbi:MAG: hypothetical protein KKH98_15550 [Spirochaetes bacterium]|nr:hypothetical protein [Spirochaetota bacterium]
MEDDIKKYAERAGDILAEFTKAEKSKLKSPEDAAKDLLESEKNLKTIEAKFNVNSMDILYTYIKKKYPEEGSSEKIEKLIKILKMFTDKEDERSLAESKAVYQQLMMEMQSLEENIKSNNPGYQKRIT